MRNRNKGRNKGKDYTLPAAIAIIILLSVLGSRSPSRVRGFGGFGIQAQTSTAPPVNDMGPTPDGSTTLKIVNSIPHPMAFQIQAKDGIDTKIRLKPCPTCKIYSSRAEIPSDVYERGTTETIAVTPGKNFVNWTYQGGDIAPIQAYWEFKPGHRYSVCVIMDLSEGRSNWDSTK
jgi:hypothetical protein